MNTSQGRLEVILLARIGGDKHPDHRMG